MPNLPCRSAESSRVIDLNDYVCRIVVIFASLTVHVISLRQNEGPRRRVLQHKAQLCLLSLAELRDYWPFVDWMYRVFSILLDRLRMDDGQASKASECIVREVGHHSLDDLTRPISSGTPAPESPASELLNGGTADEAMSLSEIVGDMAHDIHVPAQSVTDQNLNVPDMPSFEDSLRPFMPLDTLAWYDQATDPLGSMNPDPLMWPAWPSSSSDPNSFIW